LVGIGTGRELKNWIRFFPETIIGMDRDNFKQEWNKLKQWIDGHKKKYRSYNVRVSIIQADAHSLPFADETFDIIASHNVLEHIENLEMHISEVHRVLRRPGYMYAFIGPLWPTYGGCHVGSIGYRHLELKERDLKELVRKAVDGEPKWELQGILNRLSFDNYLDCFKRFFSVEYLAITLSKQGLAYRRKHPGHWNSLLKRYREKDLLIHSFHILLQK
jgi:ubiquinone/menaquinone biosynthesis C-methylase UbiE